MALNTSTLETNLNTKMNATTGTTEGKEFLLLGKAVEALTPTVTVASVISEGTTQVARVTSEGSTQVAAVQAAGSGYAALTGATFTGDINMGSNDITTTGKVLYSNVYSALGDLPSASTYHGMFAHVHGTGKGYYAHGGNWIELANFDTSGNLIVDGTLDIEEVYEKVVVSSNTSGTATFDTTTQGVVFFSSNQTANRTINFSNVNANLATGQSVTCSVLMAQGSTAYYLNAYQVDGSAVTPKWSGGSAPTEGNASGIDVYTFTIIKTANATFTCLASQTQFA